MTIRYSRIVIIRGVSVIRPCIGYRLWSIGCLCFVLQTFNLNTERYIQPQHWRIPTKRDIQVAAIWNQQLIQPINNLRLVEHFLNTQQTKKTPYTSQFDYLYFTLIRWFLIRSTKYCHWVGCLSNESEYCWQTWVEVNIVDLKCGEFEKNVRLYSMGCGVVVVKLSWVILDLSCFVNLEVCDLLKFWF